MDATTVTAEVAKAAVASLREEARSHKRMSSHHRRESQRIMSRIETLRESCEAAGIIITIEPEATSHGHHSSTRT